MEKIEKADVFVFLGLILIGTGLFLWFGLGPALTIDGAIIVILAIFGRYE